MGILNVTPDSFSDGGRFCSEAAIKAQVAAMLAAGVDIIDVGGESTRPGAREIGPEEELARVIPAIASIRELHGTIPVSIDTTKAAVARAALGAGATMVNDISALRYDPDMVEVVRDYEGLLCIMHMQGTPRTMQQQPRYAEVVAEILAFFRERIGWLEKNGVARGRLILDPGIGFGKTLEHNLTILRHSGSFRQLGCPVMIGHSRKSFLGRLLDIDDPPGRDPATAVLSALCAGKGVDYLRVHNVAHTWQALRLVEVMGL